VTDQSRPSDPSTAEVYEIAAMEDSSRRDRRIDDFHRRHLQLYRRVVFRFRAQTGVEAMHQDDLVQEVWLAADAIVRTPGAMRSGSTFATVLQQNTRSKLRDWSYSSARTGIAEASGMHRRQVLTRAVARQLEEQLGRPPTHDEIVRATQDELQVRRSNPSKGGRVKPSDIHGMKVQPSEEIPEAVDQLGGIFGPATYATSSLDRTELEPFLREVVDAAFAEREPLGQLAAVYFAPFLDDTGLADMPSVDEVARELDRNRDWVRKNVGLLHKIARRVLEESYGITSADFTDRRED
jgi:hypothetical protein